jgi:hypothetical protein
MAAGRSSKPRGLSQAKKHAGVESISICGAKGRMGPCALHFYAEAYLTAARSLPESVTPFDPVRAYLLCHSIELVLKAFLSLKGALMLELAKSELGHILDTLLEQAEKSQLKEVAILSSPQRAAVLQASNYYAAKVFEYPAIAEAFRGYPAMPSIPLLLGAAAALVDALRQPCREAK